jgi:hypothetical protein
MRKEETMFRFGIHLSGSRVAALTALLLASAISPPVTPVEADEAVADCEVAPGRESQREGGESTETDAPSADTLSDCDGLLHPAPVGDSELVEPAPDAGRTPVIEPEDLPLQQPRE